MNKFTHVRDSFIAWVWPVLFVTLLLTGLAACGSDRVGTSGRSREGVATRSRKTIGDYDTDDNRPSDNDTLGPRYFGHRASGSTLNTISRTTKQYYTDAARADGAKACAMLVLGLARVVPLDYGRSGPSYLHGATTCSSVLARLFKHEHAQLAAHASRLELTQVRLEGNSGFVLLHFGRRAPERQIAIAYEDGKWRMQTLLDDPLSSICC
jgi:hypothetical protein